MCYLCVVFLVSLSSGVSKCVLCRSCSLIIVGSLSLVLHSQYHRSRHASQLLNADIGTKGVDFRDIGVNKQNCRSIHPRQASMPIYIFARNLTFNLLMPYIIATEIHIMSVFRFRLAISCTGQFRIMCLFHRPNDIKNVTSRLLRVVAI